VSKAAIHFSEAEYTTAVTGLPHSKQRAFNGDAINLQDSTSFVIEALICAFSLRIQ